MSLIRVRQLGDVLILSPEIRPVLDVLANLLGVLVPRFARQLVGNGHCHTDGVHEWEVDNGNGLVVDWSEWERGGKFGMGV